MQVREVICPSCSHRFMWMDVEEGPTIKKYRSVETGEPFHTANPVGRGNMERILARYWGEQYW
mgnify:CR=1 FL=1